MTADGEASGPDFATLLWMWRDAAGLTQTELADLAGIAVRTVRDVERGRTSKVQRTTAVLLADALGLAGDNRYEFLAAGRGEPVAAARGAPLPPAPALIGRADAVATLVEELATPEVLVSLVGVAGVGKSTLARAVAQQVADRLGGEVAAVTVDHGTQAANLAEAVAAAGAADPPAVLLLDPVDRAPAQVRAALAQVPPELRVLAAGRGPLGLPGERVWPLVPLEVPPAAVAPDLDAVAGYPAAALLLDRLARVRPDPPPTTSPGPAGTSPGTAPAFPGRPLADEEIPALVGLARRVGGLPLALELAAAHGRLLRLPEILERFGDRVLDLGTGPTLREAVAHSYRLLTPDEQRVLRRLAAFRDRWSLELAERLLGEQPGAVEIEDPVPLLDQLVSLGLVGVHGVRDNRFRLLEVVRDFAAEQAQARGELAPARRAHAAVMARMAGRTAVELAGPGLPAGAARLDDLAADVWAALNHAANDAPHTALWLASNLPRWWRLRGRDVPGRRWLRRLLDDPRTATADPVVRAWAQLGLVQLAHEHGEGESERAAAEAALAEFRRLGDVTGELATEGVLSAVSWAAGRYDEARAHTDAALVVANRTGRQRDAMLAQHDLLWHEVRAGDLAAARRRLATVDRLAAQSGEQRVRVLAAADLAEVARLEERYEEAVATGGRVLARLGDLGDPGHRQRVLGTLGQAYAALGRLAEAERALAALRREGTAPAAGPGVSAGRSATADGLAAAVEGRLALARGDRVAATEWFTAAVAAFQGGQDRRYLVEALGCLAGCMLEPEAGRRVRDELERVAQEGGFGLVPPAPDVSPPAPPS